MCIYDVWALEVLVGNREEPASNTNIPTSSVIYIIIYIQPNLSSKAYECNAGCIMHSKAWVLRWSTTQHSDMAQHMISEFNGGTAPFLYIINVYI